MKIISSVSSNREYFTPFRQIFEKSLQETNPDVSYTILDLHLDEDPRHRTISNGKAAVEVMRFLLNQPPGVYAIADIDMMFLRSIQVIEDTVETAAVTVRSLPSRYNTGIWFVRLPQAVPFLTDWEEELERQLNSFDAEKKWILSVWSGIVQSSLARTLQKHSALELLCSEWNSCQNEWSRLNSSTKAIHLKSGLRRCILEYEEPTMDVLKPIARKAWEYLK